MSIDYTNFAFPKTKGNKKKQNTSNCHRFSTETTKMIFHRDNSQCVKCGSGANLEAIPHHIIFRSQGGKGTLRNGATVCMECHRQAHTKREVRKWFEEWQETKLNDEGYYKRL